MVECSLLASMTSQSVESNVAVLLEAAVPAASSSLPAAEIGRLGHLRTGTKVARVFSPLFPFFPLFRPSSSKFQLLS